MPSKDFLERQGLPRQARAAEQNSTPPAEAALPRRRRRAKDIYQQIDLKPLAKIKKELKPHCIFWSTGAGRQLLRDKSRHGQRLEHPGDGAAPRPASRRSASPSISVIVGRRLDRSKNNPAEATPSSS